MHLRKCLSTMSSCTGKQLDVVNSIYTAFTGMVDSRIWFRSCTLLCVCPAKTFCYPVRKIPERYQRQHLVKGVPQLRKSLWKGQLWDGSYFCETIGSTSEEKYIERQKTVSYEQSDQIQVIPYNWTMCYVCQDVRMLPQDLQPSVVW